MALASVYAMVLTASSLSVELRKANGYLAAGSATIVAVVMVNFDTARSFADERTLRFTMLWLLLVVVLSGAAWFASLFIAARNAALTSLPRVPEYGFDWQPGELELLNQSLVKALFPPLRWYAERKIRAVTASGDVNSIGQSTLRWAQVQGLATMGQFLFVAIAAAVLFEGLKFG